MRTPGVCVIEAPISGARLDEKGSLMRHAAFIAIAAVLAGTASITPAAARTMDALSLTEAAAALAPGRYLWTENVADGPVSVLISIPDQRAYVFKGETLIAASAVSTGKEGNDTPVGTYAILQKKERHFSNLYDSAPMPYMQRLTWDGVAMHAGSNPGFPASHGCIRLPSAFAKKLYAITALGATVEVTDTGYVSEMGPPIGDAMLTAQANEAGLDEGDTTSTKRRVAAR